MATSKTMYNRFLLVESQLRDLYGRVKSFRMTDDWLINERARVIYRNPDFSKLTQYYKGMIQGQDKVYRDQLWASMDWSLFVGGRWYRRDEYHNIRDFPYSECVQPMACHFWPDSGRIFTVPEAWYMAHHITKGQHVYGPCGPDALEACTMVNIWIDMNG